ncbi:MAG: glycosyltransferase family 4 protein [Actinobacteria bacterium]|nr:glycosyltransferase family 4 protein [Actinomycetota bacterium]
MRVLMVSPYPPVRDGIAAYAVQEVARLRREGHDVEVLSPGPSAAHHHLDLVARRGPVALAARMRAFDRVIVQFHPDVFYPAGATTGRHVATSLALSAAFAAAAAAGGDVEVRVHEADYTLSPRSPRAMAMGLMWRQVRRVVVHTEAERASFAATFGLDPAKVAVAAHGSHFSARTTLDRAGARRRLGLPDDEVVFLSIGFIQPHKGFDRAVRAFARTPYMGARLEVVGSVRVEEPEYLDHLDELRALVAATPGVELREGYLSDEAFDVWLVAADVVVLPYRHIWSSGVMERAAMFDRPVIASRVGGLAAQAAPGTVLVDDDDELAAAMRAAMRTPRPDLASMAESHGDDGWPAPGASRAEVMATIKARAGTRRRVQASEDGLGAAVTSMATSSPASPLARVRPLVLPVPAGPASRRLVKRLARRLTAWQVDPIVAHVNRLHRATLEALSSPGRTPDGG